MISIIKSLIDRRYDGTVWNDKKQDDISLDLKRLGATRSGNKISNQGVRTLLASLNYLGFTYLDNSKTPSTINITNAGKELYKENKDNLIEIDNLREGNTIEESIMFKFQFSKLQITNPSILKDCRDILVFPFIATLNLLLNLKYLDVEEIALYVFKMESINEFDLKVQEIQNFRSLDSLRREDLVNAFKRTSIGNIALVKAPSTGYFIRLCTSTGLIEEFKYTKKYDEKKIRAIRIKKDKIAEVKEIINRDFYRETFDFKDNLELWIEYIGNTSRLTPPVEIEVYNNTKEEVYIEFFDGDNRLLDSSILYPKSEISTKGIEDDYLLVANDVESYLTYNEFNSASMFKYPVFLNEKYMINAYSFDGEELIDSNSFFATKGLTIAINSKNIKRNSIIQMDRTDLGIEIINHINSKNFSGYMEKKLRILNNKLGEDKLENKALRGAVLEYYFYLLLTKLRDDKILDEVIWNGKLGKYNLPISAPGGKQGTPDIIFMVNKKRFILELTTIKAKSQQQISEVPSVIDHIRVYKRMYPEIEVSGIFSAPIIHERNHSVMSQVANNENFEFRSIEIQILVDIFTNVKSTDELLSSLNKI